MNQETGPHQTWSRLAPWSPASILQRTAGSVVQTSFFLPSSHPVLLRSPSKSLRSQPPPPRGGPGTLTSLQMTEIAPAPRAAAACFLRSSPEAQWKPQSDPGFPADLLPLLLGTPT